MNQLGKSLFYLLRAFAFYNFELDLRSRPNKLLECNLTDDDEQCKCDRDKKNSTMCEKCHRKSTRHL